MADHPRILIKPPFLLLGFLIVGVGFYMLWPIGWGFRPLGFLTGAIIAATGIWLMARAMSEFKKFNTPVETNRSAATIVMSGPYEWSRNPIYIAGLLIFLGVGFALGNVWLLSFFVILFIVFNVFVIDREEEYLLEKFGEDYHEYKKLVRRWF